MELLVKEQAFLQNLIPCQQTSNSELLRKEDEQHYAVITSTIPESGNTLQQLWQF